MDNGKRGEDIDINTGKRQAGHFLVFTLAEKRFALPLASVDRVVHAAAVTVLPKVPEIVRGLINYKGEILPVIDISRRFRLPVKDIEPGRHFILVNTTQKRRAYGLLADTVTGVTEEPDDNVVPAAEISAGMEWLTGVIKLNQGMMLIPDADQLLSHDETAALNAAAHKKKTKKKDG